MFDSHRIKLQGLCKVLTMFFVVIPALHSTVFAETLPIPPGPPAALIKRIVVNNQPQQSVTAAQATVTRSGISVPATTDALLYRDDIIETFANTQVTVLFFDPPAPEKDNEIIIDANARVGIGSSDNWWGRMWAKVKGIFSSKTTYAQMGASGTEYEINVIRGEDRATLIVLEGSVHVAEGNFNLVGETLSPLPAPPRTNSIYPQFRFANFVRTTFHQDQFGTTFDVPAGQLFTASINYNIHTDCREQHRYEFRTSDGTQWFQIQGEKRFVLAPQSTMVLNRTIQMDPTGLSAGIHRAHVYVVCLDCGLEPKCSQAQLDFVYNFNVTGVAPPTPSPAPTQMPQTVTQNQVFDVNAREESSVSRNLDQKATANDSRVVSVVNWTSQNILTAQPSYSTPGLIPHFATVDERNGIFSQARLGAILSADPASYKLLGDIYSDWGQAAWAVGSYNFEPKQPFSRLRCEKPSADCVEALRLAGQVEQAAGQMSQSVDSRSAKGQNVLGNIYFDLARIAADKGNAAEADRNFEQARAAYTSAQTFQPGGPSDYLTIRINAAKALNAQADLAVQNTIRSDSGLSSISTAAPPQTTVLQSALEKYSRAMQLLADVQEPSSTYPFGVIELGRAYHGQANAAILSGNTAVANDSYAQARRQYNRVVAAHIDCAEAYFNLGDLAEDTNDPAAAKDYYRRAIKSRPEQPASYYPLAILLQKENRELAAALASTYLQLERQSFKGGEKAKNAERLAGRQEVSPPPRPSTPVTVPNLVNQTQNDATNLIQRAGLTLGNIEKRNDSRPVGTVLEQRPLAGTTLPRLSAVGFVVSANLSTDVVVPNVLNRSQKDGTALLADAGLVSNIELKEGKQPEGTIIKQEPKAGKTVLRNSSVKITVSEGVVVKVPDIVDDKEQTARKKISDRGLIVGNVGRRESCTAIGKVVEQTPVKDTRVKGGSPVEFVLGWVGENPVTVPSFVGQHQRYALAEIQNRRFTLGKMSTEETDNAAEGTVTDQSPDANTQFGRNCPVEIKLTVAVPLTSVGDYVGMTEFDARRQIADIRLVAGVRYQPSTNDRPGIVLGQSPRPGSRVHSRSPVMLIVSVQTVSVPPVVGMTLINAKGALERVGLRVGRINYVPGQSTGDISVLAAPQSYPCTVVNQDPVRDRQVAPGTPVNLWVIRWLDPKGNPRDCLRMTSDGEH